MNPLFIRTVSLRARLTLALLLAFLLIFLDHRLSVLKPARLFLNSVVSPVQYLATLPGEIFTRLSENLVSRRHMRAELSELRLTMMQMQGEMQRYQFILRENQRLRNLLASTARESSQSMVAEVIAVDADSFSHQVVVNKGTAQGVFIGQPVLDDQGVVGQIIDVGVTTARVLLISDQNHAIPTRSERGGIRVMVQGIGDTGLLEVLHVPHSTELQEGDLLLSSGLGGVFPEGYPVAVVDKIKLDLSEPFASVTARPVASLDRIRMLLLVWLEGDSRQPINNPLSHLQNKAQEIKQKRRQGSLNSGDSSTEKLEEENHDTELGGEAQ